jgi:Putative zinc-finger
MPDAGGLNPRRRRKKMNCPDVRDLHFGELSGPEQQRIREHLRTCEDCRLEAERLNLVVASVKDLPAEEPLTRIRFVSDKVFEPTWWQRFFGLDRRFWGWQAAFSLPLWIMAAILLGTGAIPGRAPMSPTGAQYQKAHLAQPTTQQQVTQEQIEARVQRLVDERVGVAVAKAVSEIEVRQREQTRTELSAFRSRYQRDQAQFHEAAYSFYRNLDQKMNRVALASMEKYPGPAQPDVNAQ